jgi:hypothetical protein
MIERKRRALILLGSVFTIVTIAADVVVSTHDWDDLKDYVSAGVSHGTQLSINGALKVDLGWISRVRASQRFQLNPQLQV